MSNMVVACKFFTAKLLYAHRIWLLLVKSLLDSIFYTHIVYVSVKFIIFILNFENGANSCVCSVRVHFLNFVGWFMLWNLNIVWLYAVRFLSLI